MKRTERPLPGWLSAGLALGALGALLVLERKRPLRRRTEDPLRRDLRNAGVAALSALTLRTLERPVVEPLARSVAAKRLGLLQVVRLPAAVEVALAVLLLDYTLWVWHVLTHKVGFLWRLHGFHHADRDLSATTAVRFHAAEMALSVPWRAAQVRLIGASPLALSTWQTATLVAILFHHSNLELSPEWDERLRRVIVTPRVHGIHHSIVRDETDSNWGTIFTWPDRLHGTARYDVPQEAITIGRPDQPDEAVSAASSSPSGEAARGRRRASPSPGRRLRSTS